MISKKEGEVREIFSIDSKVELLFFYKKEATYEQRKYFHENVLMKPTGNRSYWTRDGVRAVFGIDKHGYKGSGLTFTQNATEEQKNDIKRRLKESPIIYEIFENVVPSDLVLDEAEAEKERIKNAKRDTDDKRPKKTVVNSEPQN